MGIDLGKMLLTVRVGKGRRQTLHCSTKNVNPGSQCHVERRVCHLPSRVRNKLWKTKLLNKTNGCLKVLMPCNIKQAIIQATDNALKEDEAKSGLENLLVILIALER